MLVLKFVTIVLQRPTGLPSASGRKRYSIIKKYVNRSKFEVFETYAKDDKTVWFYTIPITGADAESFVGLEGNYLKDKFRVYLNGMPLQDVSSEFFEVIESNQNHEYFKFIYALKDKDIYCMGLALHVSSINNFQLIPEFVFWAKDGVNYFFRSKKIVIGNYDAIEILGDLWYKDNLFVYNTKGDTLIIDKKLNSDIPLLDINTLQKTEVYSYFSDKFGYISGYRKKRVSIEDYEYQKIEL